MISRATILELCEAFYALEPAPHRPIGTGEERGHGTRLRLRTEVMAGTWEALVTGQADLAIGVGVGRESTPGVQTREIGTMEFVFAVAPHHPLAAATAPITDAELLRHRAVAVADSAQRLAPYTVNLLPGQDVLTVSSMQIKLEVQLRCLGCGFVPEPMAREHIAAGRLRRQGRAARRADGAAGVRVAPRPAGRAGTRKAALGLGLRWWLEQLESPATRKALLERHGSPYATSGGSATVDPEPTCRTSVASRRRRPDRCTPARWSPRWPRGSMRAHTAVAGWSGSRTSTGRARSPAGRTR